MIVNAVGCPFSGMDLLADILRAAGIRVRDNGPDLIHDRRLVDSRIPYDLDRPPPWIVDWIKKYEQNGMNDYFLVDQPFFHSSWGRFCAMVELEKRYPNVKFMIFIRDPRPVIGRWLCSNPATGIEVTMETYKDTILKITEFMMYQSKLLKTDPIVLFYDKFISGEYTHKIFKIFGIESSLENLHKAQGYIRASKTCFENYEGDVQSIISIQEKFRRWEL